MAKSKEGKINKAALVRDAVATLGDVGPKVIQEYIVKTHGVELKPMLISAYKSSEKTKSGGGKGRKAKSTAGSKSASVEVQDITTIRELVDRFGSENLAALIKAVAK